jgi:multidrug efflux pump subunit AcrA (membrane-fusion protein)
VVDTVVRVDTVQVESEASQELEQRVARLQLQLLEREAQITSLERQRNEAMQEVVRAMARLETAATRAEAASAMAEAQVAMEVLREAQPDAPEVQQAAHFLEQSRAAFAAPNYGGALYYANEARLLSRTGQARLAGVEVGGMRPGEAPFAVPVRLETLRRCNVRSGPGLEFEVLSTLEPNISLVGYSYADEWVRVRLADGRAGWVFYNLVGVRKERP